MKTNSTAAAAVTAATGAPGDEQPQFFRPLLPGFLCRMDIPDEFMRTYLEDELKRKSKNRKNSNEPLPIPIVLRNNNREWVAYLKDRSIEKGWPKFIKEYYSCFDKDEDHGLKRLNVGDFLVFRLEGNLVFHVSVFDISTGLQKRPNPYPSSINSSKKKKKKITYTEKNEKFDLTNCPSFESECRRSTLEKKKLYIPVKFFRENGLDRSCEMILKNEKGRLWEVMTVYYEKIPSLYITEGWNEFQLDNGLMLGDRFTFYLIKNAPKPILLFSSLYNLVD